MSNYRSSFLLPLSPSSPRPLRIRRRSHTLTNLQPLPISPDPHPHTLQQIQQQIFHNYRQITTTISQFQNIVQDKLQSYEIELLEVFKVGMDRMMEEVRGVVQEYRKARQEGEERDGKIVRELENQLVYFKMEALQLFERGKQDKKEIERLKRQVRELKMDKEVGEKTMQKMARRVLKAKMNYKNSSILTDITTGTIDVVLPIVKQPSVRYRSIQTERFNTLGVSNKYLSKKR